MEFKSILTQNCSNDANIKWKFGSLYNPEIQGAVERYNDTLLRKLRKLSNFQRKSWDLKVKDATSAYNNYFHRALSCSPFEFFYNKLQILK